MVNKYWTRQVILCSVLILVLSVIAQAQDLFPLPTHSTESFEYHYDPQSEVDWKIPKGWATTGGNRFTVGGKFEDNLDAPGTDWQWETEWYNPGTISFTLPIVFRADDFGDERFPIYGGVRLPRGERVFLHLELNESAKYPEYEIGVEYEYLMWVTPHPAAPQFWHDCSFCERKGPPPIGLLQQNALPPEWTPMPYETVMEMPHVEVLVRRIPPRSRRIPALSQWGVIGMALVLLTAGAIGIAWRRRRAVA